MEQHLHQGSRWWHVLLQPQVSMRKQHMQSRQHEHAPTQEDAAARSAVRTLLSKAVAGGVDEIASQVEAALFERHKSTSKAYKAAARALGQNLKRNESIRAQLCSGELKPGKLVAMEWQELSTSEQREKDGKTQEKLLRLATLNDPCALGGHGGEWECPECHSKACESLDTGRRDIGKHETWGSKANDDRGRMVTCLSCNHRWEVSGLV